MNPLTVEKTDPVQQNYQIERTINEYPDIVAQALLAFRKAKLNREKVEAMLHLEYKASEGKKTTEDLKALVRNDDRRYQAVLDEARAESEYNRVYEKLLSAKKLSDLRTAF